MDSRQAKVGKQGRDIIPIGGVVSYAIIHTLFPYSLPSAILHLLTFCLPVCVSGWKPITVQVKLLMHYQISSRLCMCVCVCVCVCVNKGSGAGLD